MTSIRSQILEYALVFFATLCSDLLWAVYIRNTASNKAWQATLSSGAIILAGAFVTTSYVADHGKLVPALMGGMLGTYIYVSRGKSA